MKYVLDAPELTESLAVRPWLKPGWRRDDCTCDEDGKENRADKKENWKRGLHAALCNPLKGAKCIEICSASDKSCECASGPSLPTILHFGIIRTVEPDFVPDMLDM